MRADGGEGGKALGGVRMLSATGSTCTVILRRRISRAKEDVGEDYMLLRRILR